MPSATASAAVTNWIWLDDEIVSSADVDLNPDGPPPRMAGQFALHRTDAAGRHVFARDPLGVNKLFLAADDETLAWSNYWIDLVRSGHRAEDVWSVPSGYRLSLDAGRVVKLDRLACTSTLPHASASDESLETIVARIQQRLEQTFRRLRAALAGRKLYVTLSGGLDSTVIAALAREWLGPFTAVTFAIDSAGARAGTPGTGTPTDDFEAACRVARELGVPLRPVLLGADDLLALIDPVLEYGQDWRDFNVHCGVVNAAIGQAIGRDADGERPVLLTGDVMNELMADYTPVRYGGHEYYPLPQLPPGQLRRFLVQGLDAGDREIGIFAHFGLDALQPYAMCADAYGAVPPDLLGHPDAKQRLVARVVGSKVPPYIYERRKTRAQIGSVETGGTLALFADRGLDETWLRQRFAARFNVDPAHLPRMIRGGMYRFPSSGQILDARRRDTLASPA